MEWNPGHGLGSLPAQQQQMAHYAYDASYGGQIPPPPPPPPPAAIAYPTSQLTMAQLHQHHHHQLLHHLTPPPLPHYHPGLQYPTEAPVATTGRHRRQSGSADCPCTYCLLLRRGESPVPLQDAAGKLLHQCPRCAKHYAKVGHLKTHCMVHDGVRPHRCDRCPGRFTRSDELKRHHKVHTKEKTFHCGKCTKSFGRSDHLKKHLQTHINRAKREAAKAAKKAAAAAAAEAAAPPVVQAQPPAMGNFEQPSAGLERWAQRHGGQGWAPTNAEPPSSYVPAATVPVAFPPTPPSSDQSSEAWTSDQTPVYGHQQPVQGWAPTNALAPPSFGPVATVPVAFPPTPPSLDRSSEAWNSGSQQPGAVATGSLQQQGFAVHRQQYPAAQQVPYPYQQQQQSQQQQQQPNYHQQQQYQPGTYPPPAYPYQLYGYPYNSP